MIDIKIPIGLMFLVFGLLLTIFGIFSNSDTELYKISLNINVNLWSGLFMLVFGGLMLFFSKGIRKKK